MKVTAHFPIAILLIHQLISTLLAQIIHIFSQRRGYYHITQVRIMQVHYTLLAPLLPSPISLITHISTPSHLPLIPFQNFSISCFQCEPSVQGHIFPSHLITSTALLTSFPHCLTMTTATHFTISITLIPQLI